MFGAMRRRVSAYGTDALKRGHPADLVVMPASAQQIAAIARLCHEMRVPLVPRGAGTGYTGGAVPLHGGVVVSLERLNRILEIDEENLLAVVEPAVITGDLQAAVEARGLFYPPDPAEPEGVVARRQHRRVRRRPARVQVRRRPSATCWGSRRCCRPARSSARARRR